MSDAKDKMAAALAASSIRAHRLAEQQRGRSAAGDAHADRAQAAAKQSVRVAVRVLGAGRRER